VVAKRIRDVEEAEALSNPDLAVSVAILLPDSTA
jgi:hypothetical protein